MQKMMMAAQLMMSQQPSGTTIYRDVGYSWQQEQLADGARFQSELQARAQEEMQQADTTGPIAKSQQSGQQGGQDQRGNGASASGAPMDQMQPQARSAATSAASDRTRRPRRRRCCRRLGKVRARMDANSQFAARFAGVLRAMTPNRVPPTAGVTLR